MSDVMTPQQVAVPGGHVDLYLDPALPLSRATLLCVHGWTLDRSAFAPQQALREVGVSLATFDRRGFGRSALAPDFAAELDDLSALVAALPSPVVLYGVSQGARLVLRYLARGAGDVAGAVVQGGHLDGFAVDEAPGEAIPFTDYRTWLAAGDLRRFRAHWLAHPLMSRGAGLDQQAQLAELISPYRGRDLLTPGALPEPMDIQAALAATTVPLLVVSGELETRSRRAHGARIATLCAATMWEVPGGGHLCNVTHPDSFHAGFVNWLRRLDGFESR